ncbi:probable ethanolamine kinase [Tanacetum coccineum]
MNHTSLPRDCLVALLISVVAHSFIMLDHVYKIALLNTPLIAFTAVLKVSVKEEDENMVHVTELTGHLNAPVVFAHNDLLSGNLMLNDDERKLYFIEGLTSEITSTNMPAMMVSDNDLEALYVEANCYMLASHLFWALSALIQAKMSPIDFDYLDYFLRYNEYKKRKNECFALAKSHLRPHNPIP